MKWTMTRIDRDGKAVLVVVLDRKEAGEVCSDLSTHDESTMASKIAWNMFNKVSDGRKGNDSGGWIE